VAQGVSNACVCLVPAHCTREGQARKVRFRHVSSLLAPLVRLCSEVQDHESKEFLELFGGRVTYMEGGIESGFDHVRVLRDHVHRMDV
jgi:hypothetical protein